MQASLNNPPMPLSPLQIRVGFKLELSCPQPTPMIVTLGVHASRADDLLEADTLQLDPAVSLRSYVDSYGNHCQRLVAPAGLLRITGNGLVADRALPDPVLPWLEQRPVEDLPDEALLFLLGSRYCETD